MSRLPKCEICEKEIITQWRYKLVDSYICPDCMDDNIIRAIKHLDQPLSDYLDDAKNEWLEVNSPVFDDADPAEESYYELKLDAQI